MCCLVRNVYMYRRDAGGQHCSWGAAAPAGRACVDVAAPGAAGRDHGASASGCHEQVHPGQDAQACLLSPHLLTTLARLRPCHITIAIVGSILSSYSAVLHSRASQESYFQERCSAKNNSSLFFSTSCYFPEGFLPTCHPCFTS